MTSNSLTKRAKISLLTFVLALGSFAGLSWNSTGHAGFVSSTGMGMPIGLVCKLDDPELQRQLQVKLVSGEYVVRIVSSDAKNRLVDVETLTPGMICKESVTNREPAMQNHCTHEETNTVFKSTVGKETLSVSVSSDWLDEDREYKFKLDQCSIELDTNILPHQEI